MATPYIERKSLQRILSANSDHIQLFTRVATADARAREVLRRRQNQKSIYKWDATEKENALGAMLGYNVIHG